MKISLKRNDDAFGLTAETDNGHSVNLDASKQAGGNNNGPSPMQLVLMAAGGCSSIDIIDILKKQRETLDNLEVDVEGQRAGSVPKVFETITIHFRLYGNINPEKAKRAASLSMEKYCSVSKMLDTTVDINWKISLNDKEVA